MNKPNIYKLIISKSSKHIIAQIIDDKGKVIIYCSDLKIAQKGSKLEKAVIVGREIGKLALSKKINQALFTKTNNSYRGRIKKLIESAKDTGLKI